MADDVLLQRGHQLLYIDRLVNQFVSEGQEQAAGFAEFECMAAANKQLDAESLFQRFDVMAYCRLCEVQLPGSFGETKTLGRVYECSQAHQVNHGFNPR